MNTQDQTIRLNKFLANSGFVARRKIGDFLKENKVEVNKVRVFEPGIRISPKKDLVLINGKEVKGPGLVYFMVNKPKGIISTTSDEQGRKPITSLVLTKERVFPIGRLDQTTTGLILLTNDGELSNKLTHPKFETPKTYQALVVGKVSISQLNSLSHGVYLKDGKTAPAKVEVIKDLGDRTLLELIIHEGKNHEVKRMCSRVGLEILDLKRVSIGSLNLGNLPIGKFRELTKEEIKKLKAG